MANTNKLSPKALQLLINFEVGGGKSYYDRFLSRPTWPGFSSGVTIGIGVDLGYDSDILDSLCCELSESQVTRLQKAVGVKGQRAKAVAQGLRDITISWEFAAEYFERVTLPKYIAQTLQAFPNSENLPDDAFGALVSLVFNRGPLINNTDRRREMANIRKLLAESDENISASTIRAIAAQVKGMSRLWPDNSSSTGDLHDRRLKEAKLILDSAV